MKKQKALFIVWGAIVITLVVLLTILGFMLNKKYEPYTKLEEELKTAGEKYGNSEFIYNGNIKEYKITSDELIEKDYLKELKTKDDTCTGYVIVTFKNVYKYTPYIKCKNYETKGYKES